MHRPNGPTPVVAGIALGAALALVAVAGWSLNHAGQTAASPEVVPAPVALQASPDVHAPAPAARPEIVAHKSVLRRVAPPAAAMATVPTQPTPAAAPGAAGMVIGIDPETGAPGMPTPEQMRQLQPLGVSSLNQSDEGLIPFQGPGGSVGLDLQGRFQEYYVVSVGRDGKKTVTCSDDPTAVKKALDPAQPPAQPRYEEQ